MPQAKATVQKNMHLDPDAVAALAWLKQHTGLTEKRIIENLLKDAATRVGWRSEDATE